MIPNVTSASAPARLDDPRALYVLSVVDRINTIRDPESLARLLAVSVIDWPAASVRTVVAQILEVMPEADLDEYVATAAAAMIDTNTNLREVEIELRAERAGKASQVGGAS